jgi:hypothetical protein
MITTCCDVPNYFENMHLQLKSSHEEAPSSSCPCLFQVERFQRIITLLESNSNFKKLFLTEQSSLTKNAIAFYVEAVKQQPITDWQQDLDGVEKKIEEKLTTSDDPYESYKQTTWYLYELITFVYRTVLTTQRLKAHPFATRLLTNLENIEILSSREKKKGSPIPLGGISLSFVPPWYKHTR